MRATREKKVTRFIIQLYYCATKKKKTIEQERESCTNYYVTLIEKIKSMTTTMMWNPSRDYIVPKPIPSGWRIICMKNVLGFWELGGFTKDGNNDKDRWKAGEGQSSCRDAGFKVSIGRINFSKIYEKKTKHQKKWIFLKLWKYITKAKENKMYPLEVFGFQTLHWYLHHFRVKFQLPGNFCVLLQQICWAQFLSKIKQ